MSVILTAGQAGDNPQLLPLLDQIGVGRGGPGDPASGPTGCWPIRPTPTLRLERRCVGAGSGSPARSGSIRSSVAVRKVLAAAVHPLSMPTSTPSATSSNAVSTGSNSSAHSPPATRNAWPTTAPRSSSRPSCYGCVPTYRTRPRLLALGGPGVLLRCL